MGGREGGTETGRERSMVEGGRKGTKEGERETLHIEVVNLFNQNEINVSLHK